MIYLKLYFLLLLLMTMYLKSSKDKMNIQFRDSFVFSNFHWQIKNGQTQDWPYKCIISIKKLTLVGKSTKYDNLLNKATQFSTCFIIFQANLLVYNQEQ